MAAPTNLDLQKERDGASFDTQQLIYIMDNGKHFTERRRELQRMVEEDPDFKDMPDYNLLSRDEQYAEGMRKTVLVNKKIKEMGMNNPLEKAWYARTVFPNEVRPDGLHHSMFMNTLEKQLDPIQKEKWLPLAQSFKIVGTYAQTELGHGTYLRGLETEATYDASTQEFIIHSPTITATKFWPGGLGKTCNYAVVMAMLQMGGKQLGMHAFLVQLRDLDTHEPCKGVKVGDIGPKLGYSMIDNGYASFDHVRIPRTNMLMNHASVSPSGDYKRTQGSKLGYFTMVFIRAFIMKEPVAHSLAQAVTIAVRYSAVRHQSEMKPGQKEPQIIDYQTQQYKLFPALATTYAFHFTANFMIQTYLGVESEIAEGNTERLAELHGLSAGLKAFSSYRASYLVEQLRLACGGHGYSLASGFSKIYGNLVPACTYEGENTVMLLQSARYLVKVYEQISKGNTSPYKNTSVAYLTKTNGRKSRLNNSLDLQDLLEAYEFRAKRCLQRAVSNISHLTSAGKDQIDATNASAIYLVKAAMANCHLCVVSTFIRKVKSLKADAAIIRVLRLLCQLYAVHGIVEESGDFLADGYLSSDQLSMLETNMLRLLTDIRPDAVALVDAFDINDFALRSALGRYDGNVYEALMDFANKSPLNKTQVHETFHKYIKPMREVLSSKL